MRKVPLWSQDQAKKVLTERFEAAKNLRKQKEDQWRKNFLTLFSQAPAFAEPVGTSLNDLMAINWKDLSQNSTYDTKANYTFKYVRLLLSQLAANTPMAVATPSSPDTNDRRAANVADKLIRFGRKDQDVSNLFEQAAMNAFCYSIGYLKTIWNPELGDVNDFSEETESVELTGDLESYVPDTYDIWLDPHAKKLEDVRYIFERKLMPLEEAIALWPESQEYLEECQLGKESKEKSETEEVGEPLVEIFEYYEKRSPANGFAGRFARFTPKYHFIGKISKNPHPHKLLPYGILQAQTAPGQLYGLTPLDLVHDLQDKLNRIDTSLVEGIATHGVIKMLVHENSEVNQVSNDTTEQIPWAGNIPPSYLQPPHQMVDAWTMREALKLEIQETLGVNDAMMGIQRRETSAVAQQSSVESGTLVHYTLRGRYSRLVEWFFQNYLDLIKEHWTQEQLIQAVGKESAYDVPEIKSNDIHGGYGINVEYGASLPVEPNLRREAILLMSNILKGAGMSDKQLLSYMKLNDLEGIHDIMELSSSRQKEVFDEIIANVNLGKSPEESYIPPHELEDHQGRLQYSNTFIETAEFKYLPQMAKDLIRQNIKERKDMIAQSVAPAPGVDQGPQFAGLPGVEGATGPAVGGLPEGISLPGFEVV